MRDKLNNLFKKTKNIFLGSMVKTIVSYYAAFTLLGAFLLWLPISHQKGADLKFIDAVFVSASGISTTGLSTIDVSSTLNLFGTIVLAMILQFGGIGLMILLTSIYILIGKKFTYKDRALVMADQNQLKQSGIIKMVKQVIFMLLIIEATGFILLTTVFYFAGYFPTIGESITQAFFLCISMTTNAGFDITGNSLMSYSSSASGYFVQTIAMFLMFCGAVGFWPLVDFKNFISAKIKKERFEFSMLTKIMVPMHIGLWILGAIFFYTVEHSSSGFLALNDFGFIESTYYSLFMSLTTRNAGFATMNVAELTAPTKLFFTALMFIGSSPNSAGGGVRTTTFILVTLAIINFARGRNDVVLFKRTIKPDTVFRSFIVFIVALCVVFTASMIMMFAELPNITDGSMTPFEILFEVASAYGTTGLSLGITARLHYISKLALIFTMYVGRIGPVALLLFFKPVSSKKSTVKYPESDLIVG